jgi:hypothetical protein
MQRAARKVAQENERLRTLLARHGILKDEVDSFLRSYEQTDGSIEPEGPIAKSPSPYMTNPGPRSMQIQPLNQTYRKDYYNPRPSPVQTLEKPVQGRCSTKKCGQPTSNLTEARTDATILSRSVEACRQAESYYASPSETDSSPPRPPEPYQDFTYAEGQLKTPSQGCCPPKQSQAVIVAEDPDCPSTADCFCPPTIIVPPTTSRPSIGNDEISCETAATIIAQMRGDGDSAAARASLGCTTGEVCSIKNSVLMQIMDER